VASHAADRIVFSRVRSFLIDSHSDLFTEVIKGITQRFEDWNLSTSSGGGYKYKKKDKKEVIEGKKRVQTYPKAACSPVQALSAQDASPEHKSQERGSQPHVTLRQITVGY
ncbi:hypothetical protein J6590_100374, partial [Homalodisca vitripennis]